MFTHVIQAFDEMHSAFPRTMCSRTLKGLNIKPRTFFQANCEQIVALDPRSIWTKHLIPGEKPEHTL